MTLEETWIASPAAPSLRPGEVHVWRASLDVTAASLATLEATLPGAERARADRCQTGELRRRFTASRGIQRDILSRYTGVPPAELAFERSRHGKPALSHPVDAAVRFNVSNAGGLALYAVALGRDVGVDVEALRPLLDLVGLAERFFSASEVRALHETPVPARDLAFFTCWTRKEAYIKATGRGLSTSLSSFDVEIDPARPAKLLRTSDPTEVTRWTLCELNPGPGHVGALVVAGSAPALTCFRWRQ